MKLSIATLVLVLLQAGTVSANNSKIGTASTTSSLGFLRASQSTTAPSAAPVSPQPTIAQPTSKPSDSPAPSPSPSSTPTVRPPTTSPSASPAPSPSPSSTPTLSKAPTPLPTSGPPTTAPVITTAPSDTQAPSPSPSGSPSTPLPSSTPSDSPQPSPSPTRITPTGTPTKTLSPSGSPTGSPAPSPGPSFAPSKKASDPPSVSPMPSDSPTASPKPSPSPTLKPTISKMPTPGPTAVPTVSNEPSKTTVPSMTTVPSLEPSLSSEPSVSDLPSSTPSESEEPSISDVPTTSANPTSAIATYVTMTVDWNGDSMITINNIGGQTCVGTGVATPGSFARATLTVTCEFVAAAAGAAYDLAVVQSGGTGPVPYTVDFKVDGVTIPELSGEMQPVVANAISSVTANTRNFRFTNDGMQGTAPTDTELDPAPSGGFLEIVVTPGGSGDEYNLAIDSQPNDIDGVTTAGCDTTPAGPDAAGQTMICAFFADGPPGAAGYEFTLTVTDADTDTVLDGYTVTTRFNGVQVSEKVVDTAAAGVATFPITETIKYRIDSPTGPLIALP